VLRLTALSDSGTRHRVRGAVPRAMVLFQSRRKTQVFLAVAKFMKLWERQPFNEDPSQIKALVFWMIFFNFS